MAYNAGVTQGAAQGAVAPQAVAPYAMYGPHFMAPFGFGFLGCLVPLAFLFLVFGLFRLVVWGGMAPAHARRLGPRGWGKAPRRDAGTLAPADGRAAPGDARRRKR